MRYQTALIADILVNGVTDGARTHDNRNHNPGLYQLSYNHHGIYIFSNGAPGRIRTFDQRLRRALLYPAELRAHRKLQKFACKHRFLKKKWSAMQDLNLRPLGPKPSALPNCANRRCLLLFASDLVNNGVHNSDLAGLGQTFF